MWIAIGILVWLGLGFLGNCMLRHFWSNRFGDCEGMMNKWQILFGVSNLIGTAAFILGKDNTVFLSGRKFNKWGLKL